MKKLIILIFALVVSINSYSGLFIEKNYCFETDGQNIVFLPNEDNPYTGIYLCKFNNDQKQKEGNYKNGKYDGQWTVWYESGHKESEINYKNGELIWKTLLEGEINSLPIVYDEKIVVKLNSYKIIQYIKLVNI